MGINAEYMGTTALTLLQRVATSAGIMKLFVVLSTASLAACMPAAQLLHPGLAALVPVGTHQWPGITTGAVDKTCFGCRPVVAAIHGRKRRDAEPVAEAAAEPHGFLPGFLGHPYLPLHATAVVGSSSLQTVDNNGAKYTTGVTSLHPVLIHGRRKRQAETEAEAATEAESEVVAEAEAVVEAEVKPKAAAEPEAATEAESEVVADAEAVVEAEAKPRAAAEPEAEADAEAKPEAAAAAAIPLPAAPLYALNGYAHALPGNSYASISTPNLYHALPHRLPVYPLFG